MVRARSWWGVTILVVAAGVGTRGASNAQMVDSIAAQPSPVCVGRTATVRVNGSGVCTNIRVDFGDGETSSPQMNAPFPQFYDHSYEEVGTYTLVPQSNDPQCTIPPGVSFDLEVGDCPVVGLHQDRTFTWLTPRLNAYYGIAQPGADTPFLVFGVNLPLPGEGGTAYLGTGIGLIPLAVDEWSQSGTWAAMRIADLDWITGIGDQTGLLIVRDGEGWQSNTLAVDFTAAREVKVLPSDDVELVSCGRDGNWDCCIADTIVNEDPPSHTTVFGDTIVAGCPAPAGASFSGLHQNDWGAVGNDEGIDKFRISLSNGWVIESIQFEDEPSEAGEANAFQATLNSPAGRSTWEEAIEWWVTPNDDIHYRATVFITGPRGTSHR